MKALLFPPCWYCSAATEEAVTWKRGDPGSSHDGATISADDPVILPQMKTTNEHEKLSCLGCLISLYKHEQFTF